MLNAECNKSTKAFVKVRETDPAALLLAYTPRQVEYPVLRIGRAGENS